MLQRAEAPAVFEGNTPPAAAGFGPETYQLGVAMLAGYFSGLPDGIGSFFPPEFLEVADGLLLESVGQVLLVERVFGGNNPCGDERRRGPGGAEVE